MARRRASWRVVAVIHCWQCSSICALRLAESIQRMLPEPEAALLIGILLGFKTPVLRSHLTLAFHRRPVPFIWSCLRDSKWLCLPRWPAALCVPGSVAAAGWIACGGCPLCRDWRRRTSGVRAAIMGGCWCYQGRWDVVTTSSPRLALAVLIMTASRAAAGLRRGLPAHHARDARHSAPDTPTATRTTQRCLADWVTVLAKALRNRWQ